MKTILLLLSAVTLAACTGVTEPAACKGEVFPLNPTRVAPVAAHAAAPGLTVTRGAAR